MNKEYKAFKLEVLEVHENTILVGVKSDDMPTRRGGDYPLSSINYNLVIINNKITAIQKCDKRTDIVPTVATKLILQNELRLIKLHKSFNRILVTANSEFTSIK